ncbi:MAG TPA: hypothetical protein VEV41_14800 [Terriglobales bacterium]|nr:hypothetical protein [Terriglobales bacterium]
MIPLRRHACPEDDTQNIAQYASIVATFRFIGSHANTAFSNVATSIQ